VSIDYESQIVYVKYVLTHPEYDQEKWKDDPTIDKDTYASLLVEFQPKVITTEENERALLLLKS